jgi:hypothetical protein
MNGFVPLLGQMDWTFLLIPLIALIVAILANIFRPPQKPDEDGRPGDRGPTDFDRFLEEARRKRRAAEARPRPQPRPEPRSEPRPQPRRQAPVIVVEPEAPPVRRAPPPPPPPTPVSVVVPIEPMPAPVTRKAATPVPVEVVPIERARAPVEAPQAPARVTRLPAPAQSTALKELLRLLGNRDSVRAAFVLNEILQPPLCHRRRTLS